MGNTLNIAKIEANDFDMMFRSVLSCFEFDANIMTYKFRRDDGLEMEFDTQFTAEGNKVTLDMSSVNPACRKVGMYTECHASASSGVELQVLSSV